MAANNFYCSLFLLNLYSFLHILHIYTLDFIVDIFWIVFKSYREYFTVLWQEKNVLAIIGDVRMHIHELFMEILSICEVILGLCFMRIYTLDIIHWIHFGYIFFG